MSVGVCRKSHLYLFSRRSSLPKTQIANICDSIREHLENWDLSRFVHSILTSHVVKSPPDFEAALSLLARLQSKILSFEQRHSLMAGFELRRLTGQCRRCRQIHNLPSRREHPLRYRIGDVQFSSDTPDRSAFATSKTFFTLNWVCPHFNAHRTGS